ncbi:excinuclease ABC A subunit [Paenibacillus rhizosphaerae]|uniref:UvrABC system protein A n=1 Tax=Paenibacillus rhizosphaerae TaxID=297318 RepID=A0A839U090_9BACL|nr:ATP-binding cassette domain-containing protein [Paenibacillus rhizosphaerae]MBB3132252.1 excinuclease ABC A subunit [Paenibacillus rhizosphaerae]
MNPIRIRDARLHNLQSLSLDIPKGKFVVITGVSGSGKSTLAFDLLYREGRRRYERAIGSSPTMEEELYDAITGIVPTVAVEQGIIRQSNPRSMVGTRTRLLGLMQLVYSLGGQYQCTCGERTDHSRICHACRQQTEALSVECFNFLSPQGMCLRCLGTGSISTLTEEQALVERHFERYSIIRGTPGKLKDGLRRLAKAYHFDLDDSYYHLAHEVQQAYLHGDLSVGYEGLMPFLRRIQLGTDSKAKTICTSCHGARIGEEARQVTIAGLDISALAEKTLNEQADFWEAHESRITNAIPNLARVLQQIRKQLHDLSDLGLSHLSLYRRTPSLSGGELQRLFLASHLESELEGLIYIFDEPTVGLHEREKAKVIDRLKELQQQGNSVIVVEHDLGVIRSADWIIEIGPGAGTEGGRLVYEGDLEGYLECVTSSIAPYLQTKAGTIHESYSVFRQGMPITDTTPRLTIKHAITHNLKDITVDIPLGRLVGVAGVSGSGKSSLISATLVPLLEQCFTRSKIAAEVEMEEAHSDEEQLLEINHAGTALEGQSDLGGVSVVTQSPIGRSKTSTPASYIGIFDHIRGFFAHLQSSKEQGFTVGDFSFNSTGGCSECQGEGSIQKETRGYVFTWTCHVCGGLRYQRDVLDIKLNGKNIAEVLEMSVTEAINFFAQETRISEPLHLLEKIGMGYLRLGQPATTISGGEAQRIKLAKALGRSRSGGILYILDEPTSGLSCADAERLMDVLRSLVDHGNSVLIIEHDLSVLKVCDWIIELGPNGGEEGGRVIAEGSPAELMRQPNSIIGTYF